MKLCFLICLSLFTAYAEKMNLFRPKTIRIYQFKGRCPEVKNPVIYYTDIQISNINRTFYVSMKVHVTRAVENDFQIHLVLSRCTSRDALDSCETHNTIKIKKFCELMTMENTAWRPFTKLFKPPMVCPFRKVVYVVNNGTFDGGPLTRFPVGNWYWRIKVNGYEEVSHEHILCASVEGQIAPI